MSVHDETWDRPMCPHCGATVPYAGAESHGPRICVPILSPQPAEVIAEFCAAYATTWAREPRLLRKLRAADLTDIQIAAVLNALYDTCHVCWDGDRDCQCSNDD